MENPIQLSDFSKLQHGPNIGAVCIFWIFFHSNILHRSSLLHREPGLSHQRYKRYPLVPPNNGEFPPYPSETRGQKKHVCFLRFLGLGTYHIIYTSCQCWIFSTIQNLTGFPQISSNSRKNSPFFLEPHLFRSMIHMKHDQPLRGVQHRVGLFVDFRGQLPKKAGGRDSDGVWSLVWPWWPGWLVNRKRGIHQPKRRFDDINSNRRASCKGKNNTKIPNSLWIQMISVDSRREILREESSTEKLLAWIPLRFPLKM